MLTPTELGRMARALEAVLNHCIRRRQALKPKEAEHLRPDLEALHKHLVEASQKREAVNG